MATKENFDWLDCTLVEAKLNVQGGAPVLRGTRLPVDAIVDHFDYGLSPAEIAEQFEIQQDSVEAILAYLAVQRASSANRQ